MVPELSLRTKPSSPLHHILINIHGGLSGLHVPNQLKLLKMSDSEKRWYKRGGFVLGDYNPAPFFVSAVLWTGLAVVDTLQVEPLGEPRGSPEHICYAIMAHPYSIQSSAATGMPPCLFMFGMFIYLAHLG